MASRTVVYEPSLRYNGWVYFKVGRLLVIIYEHANPPPITSPELNERLDKARAIIDDALTFERAGLELRNQYLVPLRECLQEWKTDNTIAMMAKVILTTLLDDTVIDKEGKLVDGGLDPHRLTLSTVVAYDPSHDLSRRVI